MDHFQFRSRLFFLASVLILTPWVLTGAKPQSDSVMPLASTSSEYLARVWRTDEGFQSGHGHASNRNPCPCAKRLAKLLAPFFDEGIVNVGFGMTVKALGDPVKLRLVSIFS